MGEFNKVQMTNSDGDEAKPAAQDYFGEAEDGSRDGGFRNRDAMAAAVGDARYSQDPAYRSAVAQLVSKTSEEVLVGKQQKYDGSAINETELATDFITSLMQDPRYQTSAIYRQNVQAQIAASMSPRSLRLDRGANTGCQRVVLDSSASVDPMGKK